VFTGLDDFFLDDSAAQTLNLAELIMTYVSKFEASAPKEALHYYYFLR
jgi:nuclear pore complex protein Nup93